MSDALRDAKIAELTRRVEVLESRQAVLFDGYAVVQEIQRINPGMKFNAALTSHVSLVLDAVVSLQKSILPEPPQ